MNTRDMGRIFSIVRNCDAIERRLTRFHINEETWFADELLRDTVSCPLLRIGSLAPRIAPEVRTEFPTVDWRAFVELGGLLAAGCDQDGIGKVWKAVSEDVPRLREELLEHKDVAEFSDRQVKLIEAKTDQPEEDIETFLHRCKTLDDLGLSEDKK